MLSADWTESMLASWLPPMNLATVQRLLRRAPSPLELLRPSADAQPRSAAGAGSGRRQELEAAFSN